MEAGEGRRTDRDIAAYVRYMREVLELGEEDLALLADCGRRLGGRFPAIVDSFYAWIVRHGALRRVLGTDPATLDRLKAALRGWLGEVLGGDYGPRQIRRHLAVGDRHRELGLQTRYVVAALHQIRRWLRQSLEEEWGPADKDTSPVLDALDKAMDLQAVLLTDGYYRGEVDSLRREDLARSAREHRLREELQQAERLATVGRLVAMVAHEVGNPLAGMQGVLEIVRSHLAEGSEEWDLVGKVLDRTGELAVLIRDLLAMSRPVEVHPVRLPLGAFLKEVVEELVASKDLRDRELDLRCEPPDLDVCADPGQLRRAAANLVLNAAQATGSGGSVRLAAGCTGEEVWIEVEDDGPGIAPEVLAQLFTPFLTTKKGGTGLGLCIAHEIVRRHGGALTAENLAGGGARFRILLPLAGTRPTAR